MSLDSLLWAAVAGNEGKSKDDDELKFLFVGGKGGVGKTTSSSAIATLIAKRCAKRVLLVSTDPAHSLSDAYRCEFSNVPKSPGVPNLMVMEVDPTDTMKAELDRWATLARDLTSGDIDTHYSQEDDLVSKIRGFQEWLSGIPGIDEATALQSAIQHVESGEYDVIVFDTAPTGHTLKLLALPDVLQAGIERLQGWQGTLWGYWEAFKGLRPGAAGSASKKRLHAREQISIMLEDYKKGVQKVALMLRDRRRTRFAVVCIAEHLSISETRRLLRELQKHQINASHVVVNQLVVRDALSPDELQELEGLAEVGTLGGLEASVLSKTVHACRLTAARKSIQERYLQELRSCPEVRDILEGICEVPLLPEEVTGCDALLRFGELMVQNPPNVQTGKGVAEERPKGSAPRLLYEGQLGKPNKRCDVEEKDDAWMPRKGDVIVIKGLAKAAQYNGLEGTVVADLNAETGRCGIRVEYGEEHKNLALRRENVALVSRAKKAKMNEEGKEVDAAPEALNENVDKAKKLLDDPEIKAMIGENPRFAQAVEDVMANPMNFMQYLMDPEMSPLISKATEKLKTEA